MIDDGLIIDSFLVALFLPVARKQIGLTVGAVLKLYDGHSRSELRDVNNFLPCASRFAASGLVFSDAPLKNFSDKRAMSLLGCLKG